LDYDHHQQLFLRAFKSLLNYLKNLNQKKIECFLTKMLCYYLKGKTQNRNLAGVTAAAVVVAAAGSGIPHVTDHLLKDT